MAQLLEVQVDRRDDAARLVVMGELDIGTADILRRAIDGVRGTEVALLLVDLRELSFMDSTGIRILLELAADSARDGWRLTVVKGPPQVQQLLEMMRIDERLPLVESPEDAGFGAG